MDEYDHPSAGRWQWPGAARRDLAADQQPVTKTPTDPQERQAPGVGDVIDQRIHRADAPPRADRQRALLDARLFRRQPAAGARIVRAAFSGVSHLSDLIGI